MQIWGRALARKQEKDVIIIMLLLLFYLINIFWIKI